MTNPQACTDMAEALSKVPEVRLLFWIVKIAATFIVAVAAQMQSMRLHPVAAGGLNCSRFCASAEPPGFVAACQFFFAHRASRKGH